MKITIQHLRSSKICIPGAKEYCNKIGLDWKTFVKEGYDEEFLATFDDENMRRVIREANEHRRR